MKVALTLRLIAIYVLLAFSLALVSCKQETETPAESSSAEPRQPNILLIVADDLGYSDIGPFGGGDRYTGVG